MPYKLVIDFPDAEYENIEDAEKDAILLEKMLGVQVQVKEYNKKNNTHDHQIMKQRKKRMEI